MTECIVIGRNAKAAERGLHFISLITYFLFVYPESLGSGYRHGVWLDVMLWREEKMAMDAKVISKSKLFRYSMQLSMLRQLLSFKKITNYEYEKIKENLQRDYGIISEITS